MQRTVSTLCSPGGGKEAYSTTVYCWNNTIMAIDLAVAFSGQFSAVTGQIGKLINSCVWAVDVMLFASSVTH